MYAAIALGLCLTCQQPASPGLDLEQLVQVVNGLHANLRDLSFVLEGEVRFVGPRRLQPENADRDTISYQGTYSYRADGATLLDVYKKGAGIDAPFIHSRYGLLRGRLERFEVMSDEARTPNRIRTLPGSGGSLNMPGSANRIILYWFFQDLSSQSYRLDDQNWEVIDGHRCLKIELVHIPEIDGPKQMIKIFWLDMARGGHPLKAEWRFGSELRIRSHDIQLKQFPLPDGETTWLPVDGVADTFGWGSESFDGPVYHETYHVVQSSVVFNQGLSDRAFSVKSEVKTAGSAAPSLLRREFEEAASRPPPPPLRTDPASVQARLDRQLAEAKRQATMIEASSAAREVGGWASLVRAGFVVLGVVLLGGVGVWTWRHR